MSFPNIPFRNPKCCLNTVSSLDYIVEKFRSHAPKTKVNLILFITLISHSTYLVLSLFSYFSYSLVVKWEYIKYMCYNMKN